VGLWPSSVAQAFTQQTHGTHTTHQTFSQCMYHCNPCVSCRGCHCGACGTRIPQAPTTASLHPAHAMRQSWLQVSCGCCCCCCCQHAVDKCFCLLLSTPAGCTVCGQGEAGASATHRTCRAHQLGAHHVSNTTCNWPGPTTPCMAGIPQLCSYAELHFWLLCNNSTLPRLGLIVMTQLLCLA
jgi:hypothetical protein